MSLIKVIDDRTGYLVATREEPEMRNQEISLEEYPEILKAASERRVVVIDDTDNDPLLADVTERIPGRKSVLIVPLDVHKELGEYVLLSSRTPRPYTRPEIRFAQVVASAAANGLANAALYEQAAVDNQRLSTLANTDDLTGLYNHRHFYQRLEDEFKRAERYNSDLGLISSARVRSSMPSCRVSRTRPDPSPSVSPSDVSNTPERNFAMPLWMILRTRISGCRMIDTRPAM